MIARSESGATGSGAKVGGGDSRVASIYSCIESSVAVKRAEAIVES